MKKILGLSVAIALFAGLTFSCSSGRTTAPALQPPSHHTYVITPLSYQVVPCEYVKIYRELRTFPVLVSTGKVQNRSLLNYWPGYMRIV